MCSVLISKSNEFKSFACIEKFESGSGHVAHPPPALPLRASPLRFPSAEGVNDYEAGGHPASQRAETSAMTTTKTPRIPIEGSARSIRVRKLQRFVRAGRRGVGANCLRV
jgi:hypothetical protein